MKLYKRLDTILENNIKKFYNNLDKDGYTFLGVKNLTLFFIFSILFSIIFFIISKFKTSNYFLGMNIIGTSKSFLTTAIFSLILNFFIFIFQKFKK